MHSIGSGGWLRLAAGLSIGVSSIAFAVQPPPPGADDPPGGNPSMREPEGGRPNAPQGRARDPIPNDLPGFKDFLNRRLEEARQNVTRLEAVIADLNNGASLADLRQRFEESRADRRLNNPQRPGNPGGRESGGGPDGERRDGGGFRPFEFHPVVGGPKLSPEEHNRVVQLLRTEAPQLHAKIESLAGPNREAADRLIDGMGARMRGLLSVREHNPQEFKLRMGELEGSLDILKHKGELELLRRQNADESKIAAAKADLKEAVGRQFDVRMELNALQITQLRNHADKLQADIDKNKTDRARLVDETTEKLLKTRRAEGSGAKPPTPPAGGPRPAGR